MTTPEISRIVAEAVTCLRNCNEELASNGRYSRRIENAATALEAIAKQPSNVVPDGYVMVPKAEFVRALESIPVPKMSPLKQELFKAGTHAVIRAFNDVLAAAQEQP